MKWILILLLPLQLFSQQVIDNCDIKGIEYSVDYGDGKLYEWTISYGTIISDNGNQITVQWPDSLGTYILTVSTTRYGCFGDTSTYKVTIEDCPRIDLFFPNAFTPNMDDLNRYWMVHGRDADDITYMVIYNRWGQMVVEYDGNGKWDGTYKGNKCQIGVYTVKVLYRDLSFTRQIHLVR